jgi:hypothetical protein
LESSELVTFVANGISARTIRFQNHNRWLRKHRQIALFPWGGIAGRIARASHADGFEQGSFPMEISANRLLTRKNNDVRPPVDVPKANV